jgi:hypothetical protein
MSQGVCTVVMAGGTVEGSAKNRLGNLQGL